MVFQYQSHAQQLAQKIYSGELCSRAALKFTETICRAAATSINTAMNCYALLEAQGLIQAKPKAGYFVCGRDQRSTQISVPQHPDFKSKPRQVSNLELQMEIFQAANDPNRVHLGSIQLSP